MKKEQNSKQNNPAHVLIHSIAVNASTKNLSESRPYQDMDNKIFDIYRELLLQKKKSDQKIFSLQNLNLKPINQAHDQK